MMKVDRIEKSGRPVNVIQPEVAMLDDRVTMRVGLSLPVT